MLRLVDSSAHMDEGLSQTEARSLNASDLTRQLHVLKPRMDNGSFGSSLSRNLWGDNPACRTDLDHKLRYLLGASSFMPRQETRHCNSGHR